MENNNILNLCEYFDNEINRFKENEKRNKINNNMTFLFYEKLRKKVLKSKNI